MNVKPMLATDWDSHRVRFPVLAQPKIDGVRALNLNGQLTGRSLKTHANRRVTERFSLPIFQYLDGEMVVGSAKASDACRKTTSALSSIEGDPQVTWYVFDYVSPETIGDPYCVRYAALTACVDKLAALTTERVRLVRSVWVRDHNELDNLDAEHLEKGFEGTILRDPTGRYKSGRSTVREGGLLRIKRFVQEEAVVLKVIEGQTNGNVAKTNELGYTERSTHQANMVPNGLVGALLCRDLKTGQEITVAAGCLDHDQRRFFFKNQDKIVGAVISYKCFPKGVKDLPRFPTFQGFRASSDM